MKNNRSAFTFKKIKGETGYFSVLGSKAPLYFPSSVRICVKNGTLGYEIYSKNQNSKKCNLAISETRFA